MKNTLRTALMLLITSSLFSCYESPHIDFHSYQELTEYDFIGNGWFPDILQTDALDIQETYEVSNNHLFGRFDFTNRPVYDSIMNAYGNVRSDSLLHRMKKTGRPVHPEWFVAPHEISTARFQLARHKDFYILMEKKTNRIYFFR